VGTNDQEPFQQLKQVKLVIAELYQENRELRQQLVTNTIEVLVAQGHKGNVTWLKRHLREVHDTIIQLCEAQRLSEERYAKNSRECEVAEEKAHAILANEHKKQD